MNKTLTLVVVIVVIAVGGFIFFGNKASAPTQETNNTNISTGTLNPNKDTHVIVYSDSGYSPSNLSIKVGDTVIFQNESAGEMWTASAVHPTHTVYPNSNIKNCDTAEQGEMFDACGGTPSGGSWLFTFDEVGTWGYHNHLRATHTGKIEVTE